MTKEQAESHYQRYLRTVEESDVCWCWQFARQALAVMNYSELSQQVRMWNRYDMRCDVGNNIEVSDDEGRKYYALTVQQYEDGEFSENNPSNGFHLLKFGVMVDGLTYYFKDPAIRDYVAECINEKKNLKDSIEKFVDLCKQANEKCYTCCICEKKCVGFGNNPAPVKYFGKCCDDCNSSVVITARLVGRKLEKMTGGKVIGFTPAEPAEVIKAKEERAKKLADELIAESSASSVESEKSKKSNSSDEKSKTRQANKERDAKKKEREEFARREAECAKHRAEMEAKKRALKKAKALKKAQEQK